MDLDRFVISPPFGNHIRIDGFASVKGSYTVYPRPGMLWRAAKTIRPAPHTFSKWTGVYNQIGLRNAGVSHGVRTVNHGNILSLTAIEPIDWEILLNVVLEYRNISKIELNVGCPNAGCPVISLDVLRKFSRFFSTGVKIPPISTEDTLDLADFLIRGGIHYIHASNTLPVPQGGESGKRLLADNIPRIEALRDRFPRTHIRAGGGIYSWNDVVKYMDAGANSFSLASVCFMPWRLYDIVRRSRQ